MPSSEQAAYDRIKADPSVGVADLSTALEEYFAKQPRDLGALIDEVEREGTTWRTAAKVLLGALPLPLGVFKYVFWPAVFTFHCR
jgi:hypothetical protein